MKDIKCFNAKEIFEAVGFNPVKFTTIVYPKNFVRVGDCPCFTATDLYGKWGREEYPIIKSDSGIMYNSPFIASLMVQGDGIVLNEELSPELHCMHTPRSAKEAGVKSSFVQQHLNPENGAFPRFRFVARYPVAIRRLLLIECASKETKAIYLQKFGVRLEDLTCEFVPSYKKSHHSSNGGIRSIWSAIVELIN